jgi:dihydroflavonol-4-reductase
VIVLVTGGTGFLGEHVVAELLRHGHTVRAMARTGSPVLEELGAEVIRGDVVGDREILAGAVAGTGAVFHLAGVVSRDPDEGQRMMRTHVDGTRAVLEAMAAARVPRMILASTSGTVAVSDRDEVLDETAGYAEEIVAAWPYYVSKIYQERLAFQLGRDLGIDVVAVNPSLLLGPGDRRLSSTGDVRRFLQRRHSIFLATVPRGGINFVDVRDAAAATVAALERGRPGERYLLGGPNWTMEEFFGRLSRAANVRGPWLKLPSALDGLSRRAASAVEHAYRARGKEPPIDRISVEMSEHYWWFDSAKAERELGFEARDPGLTLHDTIDYLRRDLADL